MRRKSVVTSLWVGVGAAMILFPSACRLQQDTAPLSPPISPTLAPSPSQRLREQPETVIRSYFSLLSQQQAEQAYQYLTPEWGIALGTYKQEWAKFKPGTIVVEEPIQVARLRDFLVQVTFRWSAMLQSGQLYREQWQCILKPSGTSYVLQECRSLGSRRPASD